MAPEHDAQPGQRPSVGAGSEARGAREPVGGLLAGELGDPVGDQLDPIEILEPVLEAEIRPSLAPASSLSGRLPRKRRPSGVM